jgi:hypothetical protein
VSPDWFPLKEHPGPNILMASTADSPHGVLFAETRIEVVLKLLAYDERELGGVEIPFVVM